MTEMIFADTFYWVALLSPRDAFHSQAIAITAKLGKTKIITTDEVLSEVLNFLSDGGVRLRERTVNTVRQLLSADSEKVMVLAQSHETFLGGLKLYEQRLDKGYSLTDCISMVTMKQMDISQILTHDHHFTQEGFTILFPRDRLQ
ncbi:type II toxin-antitoxin system VapC family toxin [Pseudanabaena sp. Chao 1811]|uniref:type II toxin-antitoxin system VapC family toxin n=1 Tax=Pseudanabaena sp. Chao 1811 TaxID=2963092 RepID=UPI0022F38C29|nr:PIN domain-containing protein [Pseudanabaena sp. Chao 1811]